MSCTECGDEHLAADDDCLLAEVPLFVPEEAPQPAPDADDWDEAGVPIPDDLNVQDGDQP